MPIKEWVREVRGTEKDGKNIYIYIYMVHEPVFVSKLFLSSDASRYNKSNSIGLFEFAISMKAKKF